MLYAVIISAVNEVIESITHFYKLHFFKHITLGFLRQLHDIIKGARSDIQSSYPHHIYTTFSRIEIQTLFLFFILLTTKLTLADNVQENNAFLKQDGAIDDVLRYIKPQN